MRKLLLTAAAFGLAATMGAAPAIADEAFKNAIRKCRAIENSEARLTCYDAVASVAPATDSGVAPAATGVAVAAAASESTAPQVDATSSASPTPDAVYEPAAAAATESEPAVQPLTDDVGMERVDPAKQQNPEYSARVVKCEKSQQSGQTYFFLDNEQVWKQANYRRMSLGDCEFDIRLSKDTFGYELYIPSKDRTIRVTRIR